MLMETTKVLSSEELFCLEGCATFPQYYEMRRRFESKECPFCVIDEKINLIIFENDHWRLMDNVFKNARSCETMLLITSVRHARTLGEITERGWIAFHEIIRMAETMFYLPGGMLFARFGDMGYNAGTVPHLHFNLWVPEKKKSVCIPVFKASESREKNVERARAFAEMYDSSKPS